MTGRISEVTVADIDGYLGGLGHLSPLSKNGIRRNIVTMFSFAKKHGYIHPDRKTAAELSEKFKEDESEIAIFTPEEMERMLLAALRLAAQFLHQSDSWSGQNSARLRGQ